MKKREFITAIVCICIFGMLVTVQVKRFVSGTVQGTDVQEQTASEEYELKTGQVGSDITPRIEPKYPEGSAYEGAFAFDKEETAAPKTEEIKDTVPNGTEPRDSASEETALEREGEEESCQEGSRQMADTTAETAVSAKSLQKTGVTASSEALISPASETENQMEAEKEQVTAQAYGRELDSAEASIKKLKSAETDTSTWSYLNLADYELKIWDDLLNRIYQDIIGNMDEAEADELRKEEKAWIKKRDADAKKVSSRYSGGTLEGLEHTASLAESTKKRAYELLENYGSYLPQEEIPEEK